MLLYSGGVDSMVCLKRLVRHGIVPFLFHFRCKKFTNEHERMIRKSARTISPKSPFYVFKPDTIGFDAFWNHRKDHEMYGINMGNGKKPFYPLNYCDVLLVGYHRYTAKFRKRAVRITPKGQKEIIDWVNKHRIKFHLKFPLENYHVWEIDREFKRFPRKLRKLAISTTRGYFKEGAFVPTEKKI